MKNYYTEDEVKEFLDQQHKRYKLFLFGFMTITFVMGSLTGFIIGASLKNF